MKKALIYIVAIAAVFASCKKEDSSPANEKRKKTLTEIKADLEAINAKYIGKKSNGRWSFKKWVKVIFSDVTGALTGSKNGGIIGAVVFGAASSFANSPDVTKKTEQSLNDIYVGDVGGLEFEVDNPTGNPFDSVGMRHNELLKGLLISNITQDEPTTDIYTLYDYVSLTTDEYDLLNNDDGTAGEHFSFYDDESIDITTMRQAIANGIDREVIVAIADSYLEAADQIESFSDLNDLTHSYEEYVMGLETGEVEGFEFLEEDREVLLYGFSVARHSCGFWQHYIPIYEAIEGEEVGDDQEG